MVRLFILISLFGIVILGKAQNSKISESVEDLLEATGETMSDDSDIQEILDDWEDLQKKPLNLNSATNDDFMRLHLLSDVQINNLIAYRKKTGTIYSIYELLAVEGLNQDILQRIEPFLTFEDSSNQIVNGRKSTDVLMRTTRTLNGSDNAAQSKYEGSPQKLYFRMKHVSSKVEYGFVAEKDPGEAFFRKSNKQGFDYNSGFANFGLNRNIRVFVGDYTVRFGQGLVAWQGFSMGKSAETTQVFRSAQGIRPYTSTDENQFFRGLAAQFKYLNFTASPFVSLHKMDASLDTIEGARYFGALQTSGYHRTGTEVGNEKSLTQFSTGTHLMFESGNWAVGGTISFTRFNAFMNRSDEPYNQFLPEGKNSFVGGIDWKGSLKKTFIFGECAISPNNGRALVSGVMLNPASNAELSLVYRNINKTYFSYFANVFTESSRVNDEHAIYLGFKIYPVSRVIFQAYADFFRFKWIKYTTAAPSDGTEFFAQLMYIPSQKTNFYLRFFQEEKGQRITEGAKKFNVPQLINRLRMNYVYNVSKEVCLRGRMELSYYSKQIAEKGFLVFQDVVFHPEGRTHSLNGRLAYYSTDGYNSRLYAYENDLLYSFAVPALYNKGIRSYLNVQKDFGKKITAWIKLASTFQLENKEQEGLSGNSIKAELKLQIRYRF